MALARKLNRRLPGLRFPTEIDPKKLSRDQAHLDSLEDLHRLHNFITVRMFMEVSNAANQYEGYSCPDLDGTQGERSDHLTRCNKMVFREVENPGKKLNLYPTLSTNSTTNKSGKKCWVNKILAEIAAKS